MIELNKKIVDDINEYAKVKRELLDFEAELKTYQDNVEKLNALQAESFSFDRAKELNSLNTIIEQANQALAKRKRETKRIMDGNHALQNRISNSIKLELERDSDLERIKNEIEESVDSILANIEEFYLQLRFKRDKHIEEIKKLSDENISRLLQSATSIRSVENFKGGMLDLSLKSYKATTEESER